MDERRNKQVDIPVSFYSFHNEGMFTRCLECEKYLLEDGCEYLIEKAIRNYPGYNSTDVIFDYAICMDCAGKMYRELSRESLANIQQYVRERVSLEERMRLLQETSDVNALIRHCLIKKTAAEDATEFQIYAYCTGTRINMKNPPYMISGEAMAEMAELLSKKTRDSLDGFFNRHFSPSPGLMEPSPRLILF